jgi:hypothetical protein
MHRRREPREAAPAKAALQDDSPDLPRPSWARGHRYGYGETGISSTAWPSASPQIWPRSLML